jgi:hypothetical protein
MFFEINNTIQDSAKLSKKRFLKEISLKKTIEEQTRITKINKETYYCEETMQIITIKTNNIEKYVKTNFTF